MSTKRKKPTLATLCYLWNPETRKILLLHRVKKVNDMHQDKYVGLGGKIEPYETPRECIIREIKEEANIEPIDLTFRGIIYFKEQGDTNKHPALNYLVFMYRCTDKFNGELFSTSPEGEFLWVDLDSQYPDLNLWEGDKIFVPKILEEDEVFEGIFEYSPDEELIRYDFF